jgi:hypothetical protein
MKAPVVSSISEHQEWRVVYDWISRPPAPKITRDSWWGPYRDFAKAQDEARRCAEGSHRSNVRLESREVTETEWVPVANESLAQGATAGAPPQATPKC